jgi:signal-transduction protein with cAMP-binding, CBS, and nucleotidyltransferase domain
MARGRVGSLLIVEGKKLVGFITQRDILWALVKKPDADFSKIKAMDLSPKKIVTIRQNATLNEVISKMNRSKFDRLPVVNGNELLGIVTAKDVLNFHPEIYPEMEEFANIREQTEKLKRIEQVKEGDFEGVCEQCGLRDTLTRINGMMVCESCKNSI